MVHFGVSNNWHSSSYICNSSSSNSSSNSNIDINLDNNNHYQQQQQKQKLPVRRRRRNETIIRTTLIASNRSLIMSLPVETTPNCNNSNNNARIAAQTSRKVQLQQQLPSSIVATSRTTTITMMIVSLLIMIATIVIHETNSFIIVPYPHQPQQHQQQQRLERIGITSTTQDSTVPRHGSRYSAGSSSYSNRYSSSSVLNVWWYGGLESAESNINYGTNTDSCELVAVRIERTSANSRRILGDITINAPLIDVWAILTDYNRLSTHVPNLVESRIERPISNSGSMGDGQFQCRLYQKGAQKIIGFEFGASVTMDMKEMILPVAAQNTLPPGATTLNLSSSSSSSSSSESVMMNSNLILQDERKITFKCVDSFFFREFDGEWKVQEYGNPSTGYVETLLSYLVDVRPKGPVPVAALEWRIREDVPTNLRAVKQAALNIQFDDVLMSKRRLQQRKLASASSASSLSSTTTTLQSLSNANARSGGTSSLVTAMSNATKQRLQEPQNKVSSRISALARNAQTKIQWLKDETMAAYLTDNTSVGNSGAGSSTGSSKNQ